MADITIQTVDARQLLGRQTRSPWPTIGTTARPEMDALWDVIRGEGLQHDHNIWIYTDPTPTDVAMTVGVEILGDFDAPTDFVKAHTPAGIAAHLTFMGDYGGLREAHDAVRRFIEDSPYVRTGTTWEVYGDWQDDPNRRRTDIFHEVTQ